MFTESKLEIVVDANETSPPDWVKVEFRVVAPPTERLLVTFNVPPIRKLFDWVIVVPEIVSVDVPFNPPPTEPQKAKLLVLTGVEVVTVPAPPPPPEQVDVVTLPEPSTERQPPVPASAVIERFVVVAWPLIVVEASDAIPPD